jgi:DNA polymerase
MPRQDVLQELGLWPVWRLRAASAAAPSEPVDAATHLPNGHGESPSQIMKQHFAMPVSLSPCSLPEGERDAGSLREFHVNVPEVRRETILRMDWNELKTAVSGCTACRLHETRTQSVFGVGDEQADWLLVGEGPGAEEDKQGEPFVGQAGKLLDNMLEAIKLKRGQNVYIANTVKCRPPGNRNPEADEVAACEPYLTRQITLIQPKMILALGKVAAQRLLETDTTISSLRGRLHHAQGIPLVVTYHPAYLLRTLPDKAKAWEDLCFAVRTMQGLQTTAQDAS